MMKWLVVTQEEGKLVEIKNDILTELISSQSYRGHQFFVDIGEQLRKTRDCFTWAGYVKLCHTDEEQIQRDYAR